MANTHKPQAESRLSLRRLFPIIGQALDEQGTTRQRKQLTSLSQCTNPTKMT
jgi:hypothetical protein